jgi:hypothetical protein
MRSAVVAIGLATCGFVSTLPAADAPPGQLSLSTRRRIEVSPAGQFAVLQETAAWQG